jgi:metallophosphoesterase superfamily enzyme
MKKMTKLEKERAKFVMRGRTAKSLIYGDLFHLTEKEREWLKRRAILEELEDENN